jgi:hypothetical protein
VSPAFPRQQRADRGLRPDARTLRSRHSVLAQVAGNGVGSLASARSRTMRATTSSGIDLGLPRTAPWSMALPIGVRVSIPISVTGITGMPRRSAVNF